MNDIQVLCEALAVTDEEQAKEDALIARLTAADALAEVAAEFVEDKHRRILCPKFVSRHVVAIYICLFCGAADTANLDHADDCLYARVRAALLEYREATDG